MSNMLKQLIKERDELHIKILEFAPFAHASAFTETPDVHLDMLRQLKTMQSHYDALCVIIEKEQAQ